MDIRYKVEFFTDWHCGSGLAAGADVDALVVKDNYGLPFIPGKTIKGLLREAVDNIIDFRLHETRDYIINFRLRETIDYTIIDFRSDKMRKLADETFGYFDSRADNEGKRAEMIRGTAHFSNAELPEKEQRIIIKEKLQSFLFRTLSSTAIDSDGIAAAGTLRRIEVTVPCTLEGQIFGLPDDQNFLKIVKDAMRYVKRLGQNRNRGLGRCLISFVSCRDNSLKNE